MANYENTNKSPYDFGKALFRPFNTGSDALGFVLMSAFLFAVVIAVINLIIGGAMRDASMAFNTINAEMASSGNMTSDWWVAFGKIMLVAMPMLFGMWILWAMIEAALHRRVLFSESGSAFPWRFGGDELRVMLCQLVAYPLWFIMFIFLYMILAMVIGGIGMMISPILGAILIFLAMIASVFLSVAFIIRFSAASALSVADKQIGLGASWEATKKRVLPSFGAYALLVFVGMIIYFVLAIALMGLLFGAEFGQMWQGAMQGDADASNALYNADNFVIKQTIQTAILSFYLAIFNLVVAGVGSHIAALYRTDMGKTDADVFD